MNNFLFLNKINNTIIAVLLSFCRHIYTRTSTISYSHSHIHILIFLLFFLLLIRIHPKYRWIYCKLLFIATEFPPHNPIFIAISGRHSACETVIMAAFRFRLLLFLFVSLFLHSAIFFLLLIFFCHIDENVKSVQNGLGYSEAVATRALSAFTGRATFSAANQNAAPVWRQTNQNGIRILKNHKIAKVQL